MEKKIICSDDEFTQAYNDFRDIAIVATTNLENNIISSEEYDIILIDADNKYNKVVYGE